MMMMWGGGGVDVWVIGELSQVFTKLPPLVLVYCHRTSSYSPSPAISMTRSERLCAVITSYLELCWLEVIVLCSIYMKCQWIFFNAYHDLLNK